VFHEKSDNDLKKTNFRAYFQFAVVHRSKELSHCHQKWSPGKDGETGSDAVPNEICVFLNGEMTQKKF